MRGPKEREIEKRGATARETSVIKPLVNHTSQSCVREGVSLRNATRAVAVSITSSHPAFVLRWGADVRKQEARSGNRVCVRHFVAQLNEATTL